MHRAARLGLFAFLVGLAASGCSSFDRAWNQAGEGTARGGLEGRWEGRWQSEATGHADKLRCLLSKSAPEEYSARFKAQYHKIFRFGYTATLRGTEQAGQFAFHGEANLGRLAGGRYTYEGKIDQTNFVSNYHSKYDHGTFRLQRPGPDPVP